MNKDVRAERLAAALRENLKRRKVQLRERKAEDRALTTDTAAEGIASGHVATRLKD
jgi:hypothetical protein